MTPAGKRAAGRYVPQRFGFSQRRACRLAGLGRSTARYRARPRGDAARRRRLGELARARPRFGYRRPHVLLRREGIVVNHERVERLYRGDGLAIRRRGRKRVALECGRPPGPSRPNEQWALDFVSDALASGRRIRVLVVIDTSTREALAIEVDTSLPGVRVAQVLERVVAARGCPGTIVLDNGPELTSKVLDQWAHERGITLRFIDPGKPIQNAYTEIDNGHFRDECLNEHWFLGLRDARRIVEMWRQDDTGRHGTTQDDNHRRPHSALGYATPAEVTERTATVAQPLRFIGLSSCVDRFLGGRSLGYNLPGFLSHVIPVSPRLLAWLDAAELHGISREDLTRVIGERYMSAAHDAAAAIFLEDFEPAVATGS